MSANVVIHIGANFLHGSHSSGNPSSSKSKVSAVSVTTDSPKGFCYALALLTASLPARFLLILGLKNADSKSANRRGFPPL